MKNEKRQSQRLDVSFPVTIEGASATWEGKIKNLSIHGMCYSLPVELSIPSDEKEVFLSFSLLDQMKSIQVSGWIAHDLVNNNSIETGVTFMFLTSQDQKLLQKFINRTH